MRLVLRFAAISSLILISLARPALAEHWQTFGGIPGCNGVVDALATLPNGAVVVGGNFSECGSTPASNIALWDGTAFQPLGTGVAGHVAAILVDGNDVFVGGDFQAAGGQEARLVARWDGSNWHALGSGADNGVGGQAPGSEVRALAMVNGVLHVAGQFISAGTVAVGNIARWNGTQWQSLGTGIFPGVNLGGEIDALAVIGSDLYVGGRFASAGGVTANNVARWDGDWHALGVGAENGTSDSVHAMAADSGDLYLGGGFARAGSIDARVARWDGATWHALGSGFAGTVHTLAASGGEVDAGGWQLRAFDAPPGQRALFLRWNGLSWTGIGSSRSGERDVYNEIGGAAYALVKAAAVTVVGGSFGQVDNAGVTNLARYDGTWSSLDPTPGIGVHRTIYAARMVADDLYVGGDFTQAGGTALNFAARWDGTQWHALGTAEDNGPPSPVRAIAQQGNDLLFGDSGGDSGYHLSRWDGASFSFDPMFVNGRINALATQGSQIFAAGMFTSPGWYVAGFDAAWGPLGEGVSNDAYALAVMGNQVYVGGMFGSAGTVGAVGLARWDGAAWHSVGGADALNGGVRAIAEYNGELIVGGSFTNAGGVSANHIARWNGQAWAALGSGPDNGLDSDAYALAVLDGALYAGGNFSQAGGVAASGIARWDGSSWQALATQSGEGVDGYVATLAAGQNILYVGGAFARAGGQPSHSLAAWRPSLFANGFEQAD